MLIFFSVVAESMVAPEYDMLLSEGGGDPSNQMGKRIVKEM